MLTNRGFATTVDPVATVNRAFDAMFAERSNNVEPSWVPAFDFAERPDRYVLVAELPGVDPNGVELTFEKNALTIRGNKQPSFGMQTEGEMRVYALERQTGTFERSVRLPHHVEIEKIEATFNNGLLEIRVPKSPAAQPRKIPIARMKVASNDARENGTHIEG